MFVGCFILEAVAFFSMFLMNMSPIPLKQTFFFKTNVETNDETTYSEDDFMSCCASEMTDSDDDYMSCCDFAEFCQEEALPRVDSPSGHRLPDLALPHSRFP